MGGGLPAAVLDTISVKPVAPAAPVASSKNAGLATISVLPVTSSKNADLAAIRVTSELARSDDTFVRCAGAAVGQGRGAPVHARASRNQLSSEKHI